MVGKCPVLWDFRSINGHRWHDMIMEFAIFSRLSQEKSKSMEVNLNDNGILKQLILTLMLPMKTQKQKSRNSVKKVAVGTSKCLINSYWKSQHFRAWSSPFQNSKKRRGAVVVFVVDVASLFALVIQNSSKISHQEEISLTKIAL